MIRRVFPLSLGIAVLAVSASAGERAQSSGARKTEESEAKKPAPEAEAERISILNKLLRSREFDIFKSGDSMGGAINMSLPAPSSPTPAINPKFQQRMMDDFERKKNWLVEPGSTTPRELEKATDPNAIPDFSRDKGRARRGSDDGKDAPDFSRGAGRRGTEARMETKNGEIDDRKDRAEEGGFESKNSFDQASKRDSSTRPDETPAFSWNKNESRGFGAQTALSPRLTGTFDVGAGGGRHDFGAGFGDEMKGAGTVAGAKEFLNPFSDPSAAQSLNSDPFVDPGNKFDPTSLPQSSFGIRDDGFMKSKSTAFFPAATAAPAAGGAFNTFVPEGPAAGGGIQSLFAAPIPEPVRAPQLPTFTPRPAVLEFPSSNPF